MPEDVSHVALFEVPSLDEHTLVGLISRAWMFFGGACAALAVRGPLRLPKCAPGSGLGPQKYRAMDGTKPFQFIWFGAVDVTGQTLGR